MLLDGAQRESQRARSIRLTSEPRGRIASPRVSSKRPGTSESTLDYFVEGVFNYPMLAECYKVVALDGFNTLRELAWAS
jgi:hypothetical protein